MIGMFFLLLIIVIEMGIIELDENYNFLQLDLAPRRGESNIGKRIRDYFYN